MSKSENVPMALKMPTSVTVTKADNGYVVSCYGDGDEKKRVAKNIKEAMEAAEEMLGMKKDEKYEELKGKF